LKRRGRNKKGQTRAQEAQKQGEDMAEAETYEKQRQSKRP
jgi:hypothetical protein